MEAFCASLTENCNVGKACQAAGISRGTAYKWRDADPNFAAAWDEARRAGVSALEDEAHRRAFEGIDKAITFQGVITDTVKEYSDTLAIFLLKAHDPDKYRERSSLDLHGTLNVSAMTEDEIAAEIAALAGAGVIPLSPKAEPATGDDYSDLA